jgi:hypothetical protein
MMTLYDNYPGEILFQYPAVPEAVVVGQINAALPHCYSIDEFVINQDCDPFALFESQFGPRRFWVASPYANRDGVFVLQVVSETGKWNYYDGMWYFDKLSTAVAARMIAA